MFCYFLFPILIFFSASLGILVTPAWCAAPFVLILVIIPIFDWFLPEIVTTSSKKANLKYYNIILISTLPLILILVGTALLFISTIESIFFSGLLGATVGMATGSVGLPAAHEMIHRNDKTMRNAGLLILLLCCYGHFKIEHIHGHHSKVATMDDAASARFGENLYSFLIRCITMSWISAWRIEHKLLKKKRKLLISLSNRMILFTFFQVFYLISIFVVFNTQGLIFIITHTAIAILLLETVEYIQHYGLQRRKIPNIGFESYNNKHTWNCHSRATNWSTFNLGLHSAHHEQPGVTFPFLQIQKQHIEMPAGYPVMILLALLPPIWFRVINPIVKG